MPLTDTAIKDAKPGETTIRLYDKGRMYIEVTPSGGKLWRMKYRFEGKEKTLALGKYPAVSLANARERRDEAKKLLAEGIDPGEAVKMERARLLDERARQKAATRFMLDNEGALSFRLGNRCLTLTPGETEELRAFLEATKDVPFRK
jgi:hypothetical protein